MLTRGDWTPLTLDDPTSATKNMPSELMLSFEDPSLIVELYGISRMIGLRVAQGIA